MPTLPSLKRTISTTTFERLRLALHAYAQKHQQAKILTEDIFVFTPALENSAKRFILLTSPTGCVLIIATPIATEPLNKWLTKSTDCYQIELTLNKQNILDFIAQIQPNSTSIQENLTTFIQELKQPLELYQETLPSGLMTEILEILVRDEPEPGDIETPYPSVSICQPVEQALIHQLEQEKLLNQLITQIRQSLELPIILSTAVEQVRQYLQVDRLVIYQFNFNTNQPKNNSWGRVTYEARTTPDIPSVLDFSEADFCFSDVPNFHQKYRKGYTQAIEDTHIAYSFSPCFLQLIQRVNVRAKLVVPIGFGEELWGLLIAHQCREIRRWQEKEKDFLKQIAEHLAVAIYQAQLYAELQQQKQTLEQRVKERTQELYDALIAAQAASRTKTEFLSTMSHELRTPLTSVIGMSATLLRWCFGQLTTRQQSYLQTIHDSGEHLLNLINDILDLSQVEAGKTVLEISEFSLTELVKTISQLFQEPAQKAQINLEIEIGIGENQDLFKADQRRVKQILHNLLSNAIKFTPAEGNVILRIWVENQLAFFQIEDTGIGIPEHQQPLLFQKFQQLDTSYHRRYSGTGLGLALAKQLIELHGGWIEVESMVDFGSTFTVCLPYQNNTPITPNPTELVLENSQQKLIILIVDDENTALFICDTLTNADYQVVWMIDSSTALEQIELLQPIILVIDLQLRTLDTQEIIQIFRKNTSLKYLKIIGLTEPDKFKIQELSTIVDDYLIKPIESEELLYKMKTMSIY